MQEIIFKYKIDKWLNYLVGLLLLFLSFRLLFNPGTIEKFKIFEQSELIRYILGISEAAVSILFLLNKTRMIGAIGLFIVFLFAAYIHLNIGKIPISLIPWSLSILFVVYFDKKRNIDKRITTTDD